MSRCPRCSLQHPPEGHEGPCAEWYAQMATAERAARYATACTPSTPVPGHLVVDLLAHLRSRGVPKPDQVAQLVLDLGWRPRPWGDGTAPASVPAGTGDLLDELASGAAP